MRQLGIWLILLLVIPLLLVVGDMIFDNRNYGVLSMVLAMVACIPFFYQYEYQKVWAREVVLVAILCTMAILSRMLFAPIPAFKPMTAIIILCGMGFGKEAGFLCGAMSALLSNMFFGQGPWTPFQMFAWGIIGCLAGVCNRNHHLEHAITLSVFGGCSGVLYSLLMDIWSALSIDQGFHWHRYQALLLTSLPFMLAYVVSNIIFLAILGKPMMKKIKRIKWKYGIQFLEEEAYEKTNEMDCRLIGDCCMDPARTDCIGSCQQHDDTATNSTDTNSFPTKQ